MNVPRYAAAAAKLLGKHLRPTELIPGERDRGIATIEQAMQARSRRRRLVWGSATLVAAAALVLVVQGARSLASRSVESSLVAIHVSPAGRGAELLAGASDRPLPESAALGAGQRIETPRDGGASLKLSTGTSMDLGGDTSFRVESQGAVERFSLQRGELSAHVAKLMPGQRFIVATPDTEVEVRGTRFRVNVLTQGEACGEGTRTRLAVTEGVVEVRGGGRAVQVRAGEIWPTDCAGGADSISTNVAPAASAAAKREASLPRIASAPDETQHAPLAREGALRPGPEAAASSRSVPDRASALAEQNDLFAKGVGLRRQGDVAGALRAYQDLIARFPKSPLAENALVERMRMLAANHDASARDEARRYLARYPSGFGAKEAEQLAAVR